MHRPLLLILTIAMFQLSAKTEAQTTLAFWNVENYFDLQHDEGKQDLDFTPAGANHWTPKRYAKKRNGIYKVVAALKWPIVMGLSEVENDAVLRDLCLGTPLRQYQYQFIHFESADRRGIDCALLYRPDSFNPIESRPISVSDSVNQFFTRDILLVGGLLNNQDTLYLLVNHWPSRQGGGKAEYYRSRIAMRLLQLLDSMTLAHPQAWIVAMGDFNADPLNPCFSDFAQRNYYFPMASLPSGTGSYKYHEFWSYIDQFISTRPCAAHAFELPALLQADDRYLGGKPFRTYLSMRYLGGYSDHLPIVLEFDGEQH